MNDRKTGRKNILAFEAVLIAILTTALAVVLVLYFGKDGAGQSGEVAIDEMETLIPVTEEETEESLPAEETNPGERIEFEDPVLGAISVPVVTDVSSHTYDWDRLSDNNRRLSYDTEEFRSKIGVDVSYFQGEIDWEKVKADGIDFAMIRLGYRGYGTGNIVIDDQFTENINGALAAGLEVGVYFFSQAVNVQEAKREAETVLSMLSSYSITMPVAYDLEIVSEKGSRTQKLSASAMTENAAVFCRIVEAEGYEAAYYASKKTALLRYNLSELKEYGLWYAEEEAKPSIPYDFRLWQYTAEGTVDGIGTNVSLDLYIEPREQNTEEEKSGEQKSGETESEEGESEKKERVSAPGEETAGE